MPPPPRATGDELEKSEARFRVALAHSGVVTFEQDTALRYTWIYPTQFYETSQIIGRTDGELFGAEDARRLMDLKRQVLHTGDRVREEVEIRWNGRRHEFLLSVEPLRDAHGTIVGLAGASTNITAAKEVQRELARALEFRDQVIGILGHDLRNPLAAIHGWTRNLLSRDLGEPERHPLLRIEGSARRMLEMIGTLLDFADTRFNARLPIVTAATDLGALLRAVIDELLAAHDGRRIELVAEGDAVGEWDAARLAQVASNLLGNALKHGTKDGVVRVSLRGEPDRVLLAVSNAGPPIPSERLAELFKPFRPDPASADASAGRGLGLGLYIAAQIVHAHGGSIDVSSSREAGTVFSVSLPRYPGAT